MPRLAPTKPANKTLGILISNKIISLRDLSDENKSRKKKLKLPKDIDTKKKINVKEIKTKKIVF